MIVLCRSQTCGQHWKIFLESDEQFTLMLCALGITTVLLPYGGKVELVVSPFWLGRMANAVVMACVVFKNSNDIIGDDREPSSIAREREWKRTGCVPNLPFSHDNG